MSSTSIRNPVEPVERKDIRSASLPFKHDKDKREKWSNGVRPSPGVILNFDDEVLRASNEGQKIKIRPHKQWSQMYVLNPRPSFKTLRTPFNKLSNRSSEHKSHANRTPKPSGNYDGRSRLAHKASAVVDANDHTSSTLSRSLLELLPQHSNNTESAIQVALRESAAAADTDILYSFDNKGPSPGDKGRNVDLGGLVDLAEQKWISKKTDDIVKGEYEVLDNSGETVLLRGKGKKSPKQKAVKVEPVVPKARLEDDDYELI
ncbi:hypothetical protein IFR05_001248 [Cadophora sp. M221]|nr:hypothetical protein IFR05_001248 [Cadophora sp. M221]